MTGDVWRLQAVNPRLNAVVLTLADQALAEADAADQRQRAGEAIEAQLGPCTPIDPRA